MPEEASYRPQDNIPSTARFRKFRIEIHGQVDQSWMSACEPISFSSTDRITTIEVRADQAGLRGILNRLWDLNLDIFSVVEIELPAFRNGGD